MTKALTDDQVAGYRRDGFLFPFEVYAPDEAAHLHERYQALEAECGHEPQDRYRIKAQLPFPWLCEVVRHPHLVDAVEDLIGPDVLCWGASFFAKKAHDPRYVSWHTDSFFYGFDPAETLTAWLAFNPSTVEAGCVRYIPASHNTQSIHDIKPHPDNLIPFGQSVVGVKEETAVDAVLAPGQVVFHHENVVHGSGANNADHPRVGLSIHYVAPHVRETRFEGSTAMLLRGENKLGHWGNDPEPTEDFDPVCIKAMDDARALFLSTTGDKVEAGGRS